MKKPSYRKPIPRQRRWQYGSAATMKKDVCHNGMVAIEAWHCSEEVQEVCYWHELSNIMTSTSILDNVETTVYNEMVNKTWYHFKVY